MSGKSIVFNVEVSSPVHGSFRAGDVAHNVDAQWAGDLIAGGHAAETTRATQKADADAAANAAGKLTSANRGGSRTQKVEHTFSTSDLAAQRAAGVVTTGPTDSTVGAEGVAARVAAHNAPRTAEPVAPVARAAAPATVETAPPATAAPARVARPTAPSRPQSRAAAARTVDKPTKAAAGKASAKAGKGKK